MKFDRRWLFGSMAMVLGACGTIVRPGEGGDASASSTAAGDESGDAAGATGDATAGDGGSGDESMTPADCLEQGTCVSWCDPETWGGTLPDASTAVRIEAGQSIVIDCDATAKTLTIAASGELRASRAESSRLTLHGNLVVEGRLDYGTPEERIPASVTAEVVFTGMNDGAFVGTPSTVFGDERGPSALTPMPVIDSDVGLWVIGDGEVSAAGTLKKSWSFMTTDAGPGSTSLAVADATGWRVGDRVVLTPTSERSVDEHVAEFDERTVVAVSGPQVELDSPPQFLHRGCSDCLRRGEALNLSRNVVIRSHDDSAHAHIAVRERGRLQLDSVELRWLGPEWPEPVCGGPHRRHAVYFHQQEEHGAGSYLRHTSIWGGDNGFVWVERTHGVTLHDLAGYDTFGDGFKLYFDTSACGTRCTDDDSAPADTTMTEVLAAKVAASRRAEGCLRIAHRLGGISPSTGERTGCIDCVATGVAGSGLDAAGFVLGESGTGRPNDFVFENITAHNNGNHGVFVWHNGGNDPGAFRRLRLWSNDGHGIKLGAYGNNYQVDDMVATDSGLPGIGLKSIPRAEFTRFRNVTVDSLEILDYVLVQEHDQTLENITFSGNHSPAVTQFEGVCEGGDASNPEDPKCSRISLRLQNPVFPAGVVPFDFGDAVNEHTVWSIRGFSHPDYPDLPVDFDLYRRDQQVSGGFMVEAFDAWLVPR